jgi:hypothetical protein
MNATATLNEARKFSPGIAEWIDTQRARGRFDSDICAALKAATELAKFERETPRMEASDASAS